MNKRKKSTKRYVIVTGGVISGIGKGITAASIGACLKARQLKVSVQKFDMYFNVDAGTLKPGKHGEVYVTTDGVETDLDIGHYERFLDVELSKDSSIMQGAILKEIIEKERAGGFLGDDVQVVPHVTNAIQDKMMGHNFDSDIHIIELGGTIGDYEGLAFVEAARQLAYRVGHENVLHVHVVYLPYLSTSGEIKTKPAQNSVRVLRGIGIIPNIIIGRCEKPVNQSSIKKKLSLFTSVEPQNIIILENADTVYRVPLLLEEQGLSQYLAQWTGCLKKANLKIWHNIVEKATQRYAQTVKIGLIAKYLDNLDTYISLIEALHTAAWYSAVKLELTWIDSEELEKMTQSGVALKLMKYDGLVIPGGFGKRGVEGMIKAVIYAIENNRPYLGICLGMQILTIAFARLNGLKKANSKEFDPLGDQLVITYLKGQQKLHNTGGTMRLGLYECLLSKGSLAHKVYGQLQIAERHRHRFEFNPQYKNKLEKAGLKISGLGPQNDLVEIVELPQARYIIGCQFHPEFSSRPMRPQPLFLGLIKEAKKTSL